MMDRVSARASTCQSWTEHDIVSVGRTTSQFLAKFHFRSLHSLLEYEGDDVEDVFSLNFVLSREVFGHVQNDELKPGGTDVAVTQKNKYVPIDMHSTNKL